LQDVPGSSSADRTARDPRLPCVTREDLIPGEDGTVLMLLNFSHRREHVAAIEEAKRPETQARRIPSAVQMVAGG